MSTNLFAFAIVLGILIFFHELGHFLVARIFGVGVERFSLGFGPRLLGKTVGITDYRISAIPLGGYVKMVGEEPGADIDPAKIPLSFTHKPVLKRLLIVAAGPCFNLFLAVIIFFGFFQIYGLTLLKPVVHSVRDGSPAQAAGLKPGDLITAIDNRKVESWDDIESHLRSNQGQPVHLSARRAAETLSATLIPEMETHYDFFGGAEKKYDIGISPVRVLRPIVGSVKENTPASRAGLEPGDLITAINGVSVKTWNEMSQIISNSEGAVLTLSVERGDSRLALDIFPELVPEKDAVTGEKKNRYMIGIAASSLLAEDDLFTRRLNPVQAFSHSLDKTYQIVELTFLVIVKIFQGDVSTKTLGGPIMIAQMAGDQARKGLDDLISFIALVSINLAILNFLPIPVLDGGHLLFFLIEAVIGRPLNVKVREVAQQAGMFVLILLMMFVFYNDITRILF